MALCLVSVACASSSFDVENRDTPIHVWLTAPQLARGAGGVVDLRIVVAGRTVVEGPVRIPPGTPSIELPTVYARSGPTSISAVFRGGRGESQQRININGEAWVQVLVSGGQLGITVMNGPPDPWG